MGMWYVKQLDNLEELGSNSVCIQKLIYMWKKIFSIVTIKEVENKTIAILPRRELDKDFDKHLERLACNLERKLYDKSNQHLILSETLRKKEAFVNYLNASNCNLLNGRWLFFYLINEVLRYISEKSSKPLETMEISILINDNQEKYLKAIIDVAQKVKMLNIVTNHIENFRKIEEYLYEKMGILVRITNNTKKALLKTNIVLNIDFPEELLNRYVIPKKGIIVNIENKVKIHSKRFSGININFYDIDIPKDKEKFFEDNRIRSDFSSSLLYESLLYRKSSYESICKEIERNESKVKDLIGINGIICEKEYKNLQ